MLDQLTSIVVFPIRPPVGQIEGVAETEAVDDSSCEVDEAGEALLIGGREVESVSVLNAEERLAANDVFSDRVSVAAELELAQVDEPVMELQQS